MCWTGALGSQNTHATVLSKLSHISWHHLRAFGYGVHLHDGHNLALRGMRRLSPPPSRKSPVTAELLQHLRVALDFTLAHHRLIWGATIVGYFFLLRRSEYLSIDGKTATFIIQRRDISFTDMNGTRARSRDDAFNVTVVLRGSKTDQFGETSTRTLSRSGSKWLCPVRAAWALMEEGRRVGHPDNVPLCARANGAALSAADVNKWIKLAAGRAGQDSTRFSTHSLRSGGATALFEAGSTDSTIKLHGRWASDCFQRYVHISNAATSTIAADMTPHAQVHRLADPRPPTQRSAHQGSLHFLEAVGNRLYPLVSRAWPPTCMENEEYISKV